MQGRNSRGEARRLRWVNRLARAKIENLQNHKTIFENQNSHTYSQASRTLAARNKDYPVVYAHEIHAYEVHAHEVYAREMHAHEGFCEDLARQNTVAHLSQLHLEFRRCRI
jgi:hypothetical protein